MRHWDLPHVVDVCQVHPSMVVRKQVTVIQLVSHTRVIQQIVLTRILPLVTCNSKLWIFTSVWRIWVLQNQILMSWKVRNSSIWKYIPTAIRITETPHISIIVIEHNLLLELLFIKSLLHLLLASVIVDHIVRIVFIMRPSLFVVVVRDSVAATVHLQLLTVLLLVFRLLLLSAEGVVSASSVWTSLAGQVGVEGLDLLSLVGMLHRNST